MSTRVRKGHVSARMQKAIGLMIAGEANTDIALVLRVSERTIYKWGALDNFKAEYDRQLVEVTGHALRRTQARVTELLDTLFAIAIHGTSKPMAEIAELVEEAKGVVKIAGASTAQVKAITALLDRIGIIPGQKLDVTVTGSLSTLTDEELEAEVEKMLAARAIEGGLLQDEDSGSEG